MKNTVLTALICLFLTACNFSDRNNGYVEASLTVPVGSKTSLQQKTELEKSISRGKDIYTDFCVQCHLPSGKGVENTYPPLAGADWLTEKRTESIRAVRYGLSGEITVNGKTYNTPMSPMGLTDKEVADVMNYIMNTWGNTQKKMVTVEEVSNVKDPKKK